MASSLGGDLRHSRGFLKSRDQVRDAEGAGGGGTRPGTLFSGNQSTGQNRHRGVYTHLATGSYQACM